MNSTVRVAINGVVEAIDNLDRVMDDNIYKSSTLEPLKFALVRIVENMVSQEAETARSNILANGYVDDVARIRKNLGIAHEDEYHA